LDTDEVAEFLRPKVKGKIDLHGTELRIQDARAKEVKLLMHKFLHHKALDEYRVEVVHPGLVEVFGPEHVRHDETRQGGSPPSAGATMPYFFPSSPALPGSPVKKKKTKKREG